MWMQQGRRHTERERERERDKPPGTVGYTWFPSPQFPQSNNAPPIFGPNPVVLFQYDHFYFTLFLHFSHTFPTIVLYSRLTVGIAVSSLALSHIHCLCETLLRTPGTRLGPLDHYGDADCPLTPLRQVYRANAESERDQSCTLHESGNAALGQEETSISVEMYQDIKISTGTMNHEALKGEPVRCTLRPQTTVQSHPVHRSCLESREFAPCSEGFQKATISRSPHGDWGRAVQLHH